MKKYLSILLAVVLAFSLVACSSATKNKGSDNSATSVTDEYGNPVDPDASSNAKDKAASDDETAAHEDKVLVAYFSCSGNTAQMADYIREKTDGTMFQIMPKEIYTADDLKYQNSSSRCSREQKDASVRVEIANTVADFDQYDTIYLGYPIWFDEAPRIIYTFLESYDFTGKTVIPFCTSGGSDISASEANIKALAPNANWKAGKRFSPSAVDTDVFQWVDSIN